MMSHNDIKEKLMIFDRRNFVMTWDFFEKSLIRPSCAGDDYQILNNKPKPLI